MRTTAQAKQEQLPGWDVFRGDHIFYTSEINRRWGVTQLCQQAYILATDASILRYRAQREHEAFIWKQWIAAGGDITKHQMPSSAYAMHCLQQRFLDYYKLGGAFELALKAQLLSAGYVLHYLVKSCGELARNQSSKPVSIDDFSRQFPSCHDGERNCFPSLSDRTLTFETILSDQYTKALSLNEEQMKFINDLRIRRNLMHLPAGEEALGTTFIHQLGERFVPFLEHTINDLIVELHNRNLVHGPPLPKLV